jgi:hypothetical protein
MIAVIPCIEKNIMACTGKENITEINEMANTDVSMKLMSITPSRAPIRPLTAAYQAVSSTNQVQYNCHPN